MTEQEIIDRYSKQSVGSCTILRTFIVTPQTLNLGTGETKQTGQSVTVTGPCNTPLFGNDCKVGICKSCRKGWEVPANTFANDAEKARATGS